MADPFGLDFGLDFDQQFDSNPPTNDLDFSEFVNFDYEPEADLSGGNFFDEAFAGHAADVDMAALDAQMTLKLTEAEATTTGMYYGELHCSCPKLTSPFCRLQH